MVKFTNKVRRGLRQMLELGMEAGVMAAIERKTDKSLPRDQRMTAGEQQDMLAALAWVKQAVAALDVAEGLGRDADEPGTGRLAAALQEMSGGT